MYFSLTAFVPSWRDSTCPTGPLDVITAPSPNPSPSYASSWQTPPTPPAPYIDPQQTSAVALPVCLWRLLIQPLISTISIKQYVLARGLSSGMLLAPVVAVLVARAGPAGWGVARVKLTYYPQQDFQALQLWSTLCLSIQRRTRGEFC